MRTVEHWSRLLGGVVQSLSWSFSEPDWMKSWAYWSDSLSWLWAGDWTRDLWRFLLTWIILWFYENCGSSGPSHVFCSLWLWPLHLSVLMVNVVLTSFFSPLGLQLLSVLNICWWGWRWGSTKVTLMLQLRLTIFCLKGGLPTPPPRCSTRAPTGLSFPGTFGFEVCLMHSWVKVKCWRSSLSKWNAFTASKKE